MRFEDGAPTAAPKPPARSRTRRRLATGITLAVAAMLLLVAVPAPGGATVAPSTDAAGATRAAVHGVLRTLRGAWAERTLDRVVPKQLTAAKCRPALQEILADPKHPSLRQAALLAAHFGMTDLAATMSATLAGVEDEGGRATLITVIDRLQPWSPEELAELLTAGSTGGRIAALQVAADRADPPVGLIVELLVDERPEIRAAALAATPAELPPELGEQLAANMREVGDDQAKEALLALGRCRASQVVDELLYLRLGASDHSCNTVLEALGRRGEPLRHPEYMLGIAGDRGQPIATRARALRCLEQTATAIDPAQLGGIAHRHPVVDYFVARSLLRARQRAGLDLLLQVVRADDAGRDETEAAMIAEARMGARQLLGQLAGTTTAADPEHWESWIAQRPDLGLVALPPPAVQLSR